MSAASLCHLSRQLQAVFDDEQRFSLLTSLAIDPDTEQAEIKEAKGFDRLLEEALAALIDLSAYSNPEREYPDLTTWFKFECPNMSYGRTIDIFRIVDGKIVEVTTLQPPPSQD